MIVAFYGIANGYMYVVDALVEGEYDDVGVVDWDYFYIHLLLLSWLVFVVVGTYDVVTAHLSLERECCNSHIAIANQYGLFLLLQLGAIDWVRF